MKKLFLLLTIASLFFISCGSKKQVNTPLTAQVNVVSEDPYKTITLRSIGFGKNKDAAQYDSERKAFEILFFRGIPNTSVEQPLVGPNENEIMSKHAAYFNDFFKDRYKSFIMSIYNASPPQKNKGQVSVVNDIKINLIALKKELENRGVKRRFGF